MRKRVLAMAALAAAATVLATAGAGTGSATTSGLDLRDTAAVDSYLRSIGIDPATVVRQSGLQNYAGPNCPGSGWTCTTATRVIQVAPAGGTNIFELSSSGPPSTDCMAFQGGPATHNKVHCKMRSTADQPPPQEADIFQEGERNLAIVDFDIISTGGPEQDAIQTARVEQEGTEKNDVHIDESVKQSTSVGLTQSQEAHQVAIVLQDVEGSENYAHVHQSQDQRESGSATIQDQNTEFADLSDPDDEPVVEDCAPDPDGKPQPNACAYISQSTALNGDGASHKSDVHQSINQDQSTKALFADQDQGDFPGGIEGEIDPTNPPELGTSNKEAHQDHRQRQSGPNGTSQRQVIDPDCCGFGTTIGGERNISHFHQFGVQSATAVDDPSTPYDDEGAQQFLRIRGATNHIAEPDDDVVLLSNGGGSDDQCKLTHHARNNEDSVHFTFDPEICTYDIETVCLSTAAAPEFEEQPGCTEPPSENGDEFGALTLVFPLASTPTYGLAIEPANLGEPDGFIDPLLSG